MIVSKDKSKAAAAEPKPKRPYKTRNRMSESEKLMRDLEANYKFNRKLLLKSLENCRIGTTSYLQHLKALDDQFLTYAELRRDIGILAQRTIYSALRCLELCY